LSCRGCCRYSEENSIWSAHLLKEEKARLGKIRIVADPGQNNFICGFFNKEDNKCKIYPMRPFECQLYPFVFDRKDNNIFLALDLNCTFVKENRQKEEFKEYTQYLTALIKSPACLIFLKNNRQLIQEYADVLDMDELNI